MEINIENRDSYIYVQVSGQTAFDRYGWEKIESVRVDVVGIIKKTGIYKLLFDCRDLSGKLTMMDRFHLAVLFVKENIKFVTSRAPLLEIAFVVNPSLIDAEKFGQKVANNRGLHGLVTDNLQEALSWLEIKSASD